MPSGNKVRVAIVGVGNCASSLVQGRYYYENAKEDDFVPGLMHVNLGGYHVRDIEFVAAFDVNANKVGKDLGEAIYAKPNNTITFCDVPADRRHGAARHDHGRPRQVPAAEVVQKAPGPTVDVVGILKERRGRRDGLLPAGRQRGGHQVVRRAGHRGRRRLRQRHPRLHRPRARLAAPIRRGRPADHRRRHQEPGRRHHHPPRADPPVRRTAASGSTAPTSSTSAATPTSSTCSSASASSPRRSARPTPSPRMLDYELDRGRRPRRPVATTCRGWRTASSATSAWRARPSVTCRCCAELKLEVWDSPNSAGVIIDAIRCVKLGLDRGLAGTLVAPSAYFMKSPPQQIHDDVARKRVEAFIRGEDNATLTGTESDAVEEAEAVLAAASPSRRRSRSPDRRDVSGVDYAPHRRSQPGAAPRSRRPSLGAVRGHRLPRRVVRCWCACRCASASPSPDRASRPATTCGRRSGASSSATPPTCWACPPDHRDVAGLARGVYGTYARFTIELMRLPGLPADEPCALMRRDGEHHDRFMALWRAVPVEGRGIIAVAGHIGSIEVFAGRLRQRGHAHLRPGRRLGLPRALRAAQPRRRARWGVTIIPWRSCARSSGSCATPAILGMVVDWGYRSDDLPVKLFGAWTTLPAGPATLAARTGACIVPVVARRRRRRTLHAHHVRPHRGRRLLPWRARRGHPGDRRRARGHDRRGARPVVHLQADVARDRGRSEPSSRVAPPRRRAADA